MYRLLILVTMSAARQQVGQSTAALGRMRQATIITVLDRKPGGPGSILSNFADGAFLSNV